MTDHNQIAIDIFNNEIRPNVPTNIAELIILAEAKSMLQQAIANNVDLLVDPHISMADILISYCLDCHSPEDRQTAVASYILWSTRIHEEKSKAAANE